jgi:hypothetical protein
MTTIYHSTILEGYHENFARHGHLENVEMIVVGDRKTPDAVRTSCDAASSRGLKTTYLCPDQQEEYLKKFNGFARLIPYNSDNRRNVGYLMALDKGADFVISIDDDNYCAPESDAWAEHSVVCAAAAPLEVLETDRGWFNICDMLTIEPAYRVYPRGFPMNQRHIHFTNTIKTVNGRIGINAGLWLSEPDCDALTWLIAPMRATSMKGGSRVLGPRAWTPINSQNTSMRRDAMVAYYFIRMGYRIEGLMIDRYGDIFSGYFAMACALHMGDYVRVGTPWAMHHRNSHNYLRDATAELACIWMLEDLLPWLQEVDLQGATYSETYRSLSFALEEVVESLSGFVWTDAARGYIHQTAFHMRSWADCCDKIGV